MSTLVSQLITPQVQAVFTYALIVLAALYVLIAVWVSRDAYKRGANVVAWTLVSLIPIVGVIAYCMLRPPLYKLDKTEQELEVALKRRELSKYGECANCGYPVRDDYVVCPHCHQRLKNQCPTCGRALDPTWDVCPYCATMIPNAVRTSSQGGSERYAEHANHRRA